LRRSRLKEGRQNVVAPRTNRKDGPDRDVVLEIGRSVERINRNAKRRLGIERSGNAASSERTAATGALSNARRIISSAATSMSFCRSPSGLMPPFRPVMPANGPSAIKAARSIEAAAMAAITSPTAAPCGVSEAVLSRCERKVARSSMTVSPHPLRDALNADRQSANIEKRNLPNK
jgi:hypothetical protein